MMNASDPLDWLLALLLGYSVVRAAMRGFFREALALGGLAAGFFLAVLNYRSFAVHLSGLLSSPPLAQFAAFVLILLALMVAASLLGKLLKRTASAVGLGFLDRLLGAAFGLLRGALLGMALLLAVTAFLPTSPWIQQSSMAPYFLRGVHAVSFVMPSDLRQRLLDGLEDIKHTTPDWIKPGSPSHNKH